MQIKFILAISVVSLCVGTLIYSAVRESSKPVLTVVELVESGTKMDRVRLGARVSEGSILYQTEPELLLRFKVHDILEPGAHIGVVYHGIMPDTMAPGRDVILEGAFDGQVLKATSLLTQCPSKYVPPDPGETSLSESQKTALLREKS